MASLRKKNRSIVSNYFSFPPYQVKAYIKNVKKRVFGSAAIDKKGNRENRVAYAENHYVTSFKTELKIFKKEIILFFPLALSSSHFTLPFLSLSLSALFLVREDVMPSG